jgi:hypothetical protein
MPESRSTVPQVDMGAPWIWASCTEQPHGWVMTGSVRGNGVLRRGTTSTKVSAVRPRTFWAIPRIKGIALAASLSSVDALLPSR